MKKNIGFTDGMKMNNTMAVFILETRYPSGRASANIL